MHRAHSISISISPSTEIPTVWTEQLGLRLICGNKTKIWKTQWCSEVFKTNIPQCLSAYRHSQSNVVNMWKKHTKKTLSIIKAMHKQIGMLKITSRLYHKSLTPISLNSSTIMDNVTGESITLTTLAGTTYSKPDSFFGWGWTVRVAFRAQVINIITGMEFRPSLAQPEITIIMMTLTTTQPAKQQAQENTLFFPGHHTTIKQARLLRFNISSWHLIKKQTKKSSPVLFRHPV